MRVTNGILPIKVDSGPDGRELERACLLINSLAVHWRGNVPFTLHVVCISHEIDRVRNALASIIAPKLEIILYREDQIFDSSSSFFSIKGMYNQQIIKLVAPIVLHLGPFIAFDADIICLRDFDEKTFCPDGKLISWWEPKRIHSWWENGMSGCELTTNLDEPGLGVTPNVLHEAVCVSFFDNMKKKGWDGVDRLCWLTKHHPSKISYDNEKSQPLVWTEYSLYTMAGEAERTLYQYHHSEANAKRYGVKVHSARNVWGKDSLQRLINMEVDEGYFIVIQSWAGVPIEMIKSQLGLSF